MLFCFDFHPIKSLLPPNSTEGKRTKGKMNKPATAMLRAPVGRRLAARWFAASSGHVARVSSAQVKVRWDSQCPLCTKEITFLKRHVKHKDRIDFVDLCAKDAVLPMGVDAAAPGCPVSTADLLARFHAQQFRVDAASGQLAPSGELLSGAPAFALMWKASGIAGFQQLGTLAERSPTVMALLEKGYVWFLRYRPAVQAFVRRRHEKKDHD